MAAIAGASIGGAVLISLIVAACIFWRRRKRVHTSSQRDTMTERENTPRHGWIPWSRNEQPFPEASITAWYPPSGSSSQAQDIDTRRYTSSGIVNDGLPPNTSSNSRPSKHRTDFGGQAAAPTHATNTSSISPVREQSGSGVNGGTSTQSRSIPTSTSSQPNPPQGNDHESVATAPPSAPQDPPATTNFLTPVMEEDAGLVFREGQQDTLPPAYNPGWNRDPP